MSPVTVGYALAIPCEFLRGASGRAPAMYTHVERRDGGIRAVLTLLDTGAAVSVFDGEVARSALGFDPTLDAIGVLPLSGLAGPGYLGYVHELHCYLGGYDQYLDLRLHVAFSDPNAAPLPFNVLGREGLNADQERGFFSQVRFGYQHRVPGGPPEVYLSLSP